jgi:hypothetical protein
VFEPLNRLEVMSVYRYGEGAGGDGGVWLGDDPEASGGGEVGLCRLNQVDPYPITYSLPNP